MLLFIVYCSSSAQELLMPVIPENDSLISDTSRHYLYNNLFPAEPFLSNRMVKLPDFDFTGRRDYFVSDFGSQRFITGNFFTFSPGFALMPFMSNGYVLSSANYRINDRFSMGGFSYGGNSIFTAPFPKGGVDNFDFRGSTLFMEYNVSKNFKIGTSVTVTRSPGF